MWGFVLFSSPIFQDVVYAWHIKPRTQSFHFFHGVGSDKESYAEPKELYPVLLFHFLPTMAIPMPKFHYCGQVACFPSLAKVHRHSPNHSGLHCGLSSIQEVWAAVGQPSAGKRDRQPHPGRHIFFHYPEGFLQDKHLVWESHPLLCGGSSGQSWVPREFKGKGSNRGSWRGTYFCWIVRWETL